MRMRVNLIVRESGYRARHSWSSVVHKKVHLQRERAKKREKRNRKRMSHELLTYGWIDLTANTLMCLSYYCLIKRQEERILLPVSVIQDRKGECRGLTLLQVLHHPSSFSSLLSSSEQRMKPDTITGQGFELWDERWLTSFFLLLLLLLPSLCNFHIRTLLPHPLHPPSFWAGLLPPSTGGIFFLSHFHFPVINRSIPHPLDENCLTWHQPTEVAITLPPDSMIFSSEFCLSLRGSFSPRCTLVNKRWNPSSFYYTCRKHLKGLTIVS